MPDITSEIAAFQSAVLGRDVRDAIVNLANKLNNDLEDATAPNETYNDIRNGWVEDPIQLSWNHAYIDASTGEVHIYDEGDTKLQYTNTVYVKNTQGAPFRLWVASSLKARWYIYNSSKVYYTTGGYSEWVSGVNYIHTAPGDYIRISVKKADDSAIVIGDLSGNTNFRRYLYTDTSTSIAGKAADAETVGEMFGTTLTVAAYDGNSKVENENKLAHQTTNTICRVSNQGGETNPLTDAPPDIYVTSYFWLVTAGNNHKVQYIFDAITPAIYWRFYTKITDSSDPDYPGKWGDWRSTMSATNYAPDDLTGLTKLADLPVNTSINIKNFTDIEDGPAPLNGLNAYSWVVTIGKSNWTKSVYDDTAGAYVQVPMSDKMQLILRPSGYPYYTRFYNYKSSAPLTSGWSDWISSEGDGELPYYAAFGASTTVGAVHHFDGQPITYNENDYPSYVGKTLKLRTANYGIGTTGFMARGTNGNRNNFMDQIFTHDSVLKKCKLISILFGYGNDYDYVGTGRHLPVGKYDDYYPFDIDAFRGDGQGGRPGGYEGIAYMLDRGATLFGCLNWAIKWIGEKYPRAQLVLIFGAASANQKQTVTVSANTGEDIAPYKLTFENTHTSAATGKQHGTWEIMQELPKLKQALNIPIIDCYNDEGHAFSYYQCNAQDDDGMFSIFSTTGDEDDPTSWEVNIHPNADGYLSFARYIGGLIIRQFKH